MTVSLGTESFVTVVYDKAKEDGSTGVISWCSLNWRKLLAEVVATFLLIFLGCAACIPIDGFSIMPPMYAPLGFGFAVIINVQTFGHISGAHMNPCITLLAIIWGKMSIVLGISYFVAQVIGAVVATWVLSNASPVDFVAKGICVTQPHARLVEWQALIVEVVLTLTLCLITSGLWDPVNEGKQDSSAIKFGLAIAGLSFAGGPLTGASMNPVRSLGPAVVTGVWTAHWVYWVGPFLSVFLATIYKFVWLENPKQLSQN